MFPAAFFRPLVHDMQALAWFFRIAIVLVMVWFAVKNSHLVDLHGLPEQSAQAPLVLVVLVAFVAGVVVGLLAWLPTVFRQRREAARLRRAARTAATSAPPPVPKAPALPTDAHGV